MHGFNDYEALMVKEKKSPLSPHHISTFFPGSITIQVIQAKEFVVTKLFLAAWENIK